MKMVWKTPTTTSRKTSGPATGCRKTRIQAARPLGCDRRAIGGLLADAARPTARHFGTSCRIGSSLGSGLGIAPGQKVEDLRRCLRPARALISATGAPSSSRELPQIQLAAAAAQIVRHIEDDQRGQAERQDRRGQHQVAAQVGGIEHQQDGFGLRRVGALAGEHVVGDLLVFRARREAVDARQIDDARRCGRRAVRRCRCAAPP